MPAAFRPLATYVGLGALLAQVVAPGPSPEHAPDDPSARAHPGPGHPPAGAAAAERLYLSYMYVGSTIDLVAVDPLSGGHEVLDNPAPSESGAWGMTVGADGCVYLGTLPQAHLLRHDPVRGTYEDLGRPAASESYIWALAAAADGCVYGATYPSAKLVRFDPATGLLEDLGRLDPEEMYARHLAAGPDGFVYAGIGTRRANVVAYEIATGQHRSILPEAYRTTGTARVWTAAGGAVYAEAGGQHFRLGGWEATPAEAGPGQGPPPPRLRDGRAVRVEGGARPVLRVWGAGGALEAESPLAYRGRPVPIFRLCTGPDRALYCSTVLPLNLWRLDPGSGAAADLGRHGGGECYSLLAHNGQVLMAAYSAEAPLMALRAGAGGVRGIHFPGEDAAWRPQAMVAGPDGRVWVGAVAGYGRLGGFLVAWDAATDRVGVWRDVVEDQSVSSLAFQQDLLAGGTSIGGGGGSTPTRGEACLFIWDPHTERKIWEGVPVAGAAAVTDLVAHPDGLLYGFAGTTLFAFDAARRQVVRTAQAPVRALVYNAAVVRPDGSIWACDAHGVVAIDPPTLAVTRVAASPEPVTAGFAVQDDAVFFACGPTVWRCDVGP